MSRRQLGKLSTEHLAGLSRAQLESLLSQANADLAMDRKEMQLLHYQPGLTRLPLHQSDAKIILAGGGNRSGKTTSLLARMATMATGVVPHSMRDSGIDWKKRLRGPINCRFVCSNLTTVWDAVVRRALKWDEWSGSNPGGAKGHWGFIPRDCLINGSWKDSWSASSMTLKILYRAPDDFGHVVGESMLQIMSHNQDADSHASADMHMILLDEPPPYAVFKESQARTMGVGGQILIAMTWPKDPTINVDWIFDEIYSKGIPGPGKHPEVDYFEISTYDNDHIDQESVQATASMLDERMRNTMLLGKPMRFSNRIHEWFTDSDDYWCLGCGRPRWIRDDGMCVQCGSPLLPFNHVSDFEHDRTSPVIWALDPHPQKPHMAAYFSIHAGSEIRMIAEMVVKGGPGDVRAECDRLESELKMHVRQRLIDPRMGGSPSGAERGRTWIDEFSAHGLHCDAADPSDVGRGIFNELLKPDIYTGRPRFKMHSRCPTAIQQLKRFMWDDYKLGSDRDLKQRPKKKDDDFPALIRYVCNSDPQLESLLHGSPVVRARNTAKQNIRMHSARRARSGTYGLRR